MRRRATLRRRRPIARQSRRGASEAVVDRLFSLYVRTRDGGCVMEGLDFDCSTQLQCAHLKSRRYRCIRWDPDNAVCLCARHHRWSHDNPDRFAAFVEALHPGRWDALNARLREGARPDRDAVAQHLRRLLSTIPPR